MKLPFPLPFAAAAALCIAPPACQSLVDVPPVSVALMAGTGSSAADLETGRRIYTTQCTACHSAEPIGRHSANQWRELLGEMARRAKLDANEKERLLAYILAVRRTLDEPR
jgi:mono/diheme cytochrome c family protein